MSIVLTDEEKQKPIGSKIEEILTESESQLIGKFTISNADIYNCIKPDVINLVLSCITPTIVLESK